MFRYFFVDHSLGFNGKSPCQSFHVRMPIPDEGALFSWSLGFHFPMKKNMSSISSKKKKHVE
jgi:hypothetical protein